MHQFRALIGAYNCQGSSQCSLWIHLPNSTALPGGIREVRVQSDNYRFRHGKYLDRVRRHCAFFARVAIILVCVAIGFVGLQRSAALYDGVITLLEPTPLDLAFAILYCLSQHKR